METTSTIHRFIRSFRNGLKLLKNGHREIFWNQLAKRTYSTSVSFGLRRDLEVPFNPPDATVELSIRAFRKNDTDLLLENGKLMETDPKLAQDQLNLINADIRRCYVATTPDDIPCYMQWLVGPNDNKEYPFEGIFPHLQDDEALLEGAFVPPSFRGMRIMPAAMARIAEMGTAIGARWVLTFVDIKNIASLKGCERAGFSPYILRKVRWFLFRRSVTYESIPEDLMKYYSREITGQSAKQKVA